MKNPVVDGIEIEFDDGSVSGDLVIIGPLSTKVQIRDENEDWKFIYKTPLTVSASNVITNKLTSGTGSGVFIPGSTKVLVEGGLVVFPDDVAIIIVSGTNKTPPPAVTTDTVIVVITDEDPKQNKVETN